jgi:hypothetical protein
MSRRTHVLSRAIKRPRRHWQGQVLTWKWKRRPLIGMRVERHTSYQIRFGNNKGMGQLCSSLVWYSRLYRHTDCCRMYTIQSSLQIRLELIASCGGVAYIFQFVGHGIYISIEIRHIDHLLLTYSITVITVVTV